MRIRLDDDLIEKICELLKLRLPWRKIAHAIGVTDRTLQNWRNRGKEAKSGLYRRLFEAIDAAKAEMYEEYASLVRDATLFGGKTVTKKIVIAADGSRRTEIIEKTTPPNAELAMRLLALEDPANWSELKHIKIDWQKPIEEAGIQPEQVEQAFFNFLAEHQDEIGNGEIEIPIVPNRTA